ncbi:hypothetical protein GVAV_001497 [Gurleya vavrai]
MTDRSNNIKIIDYIELIENEELKQSKAYLIYKKKGNSKIFNLIESFDTKGTFISINDKNYKLASFNSNTKHNKIIFDDNKIIYENYCNEEKLFCDENNAFELDKSIGDNDKSEMIKFLIDSNKDYYFKKMQAFVFSTKNEKKSYGHCIYEIKDDYLFCNVLLAKKYNRNYFYWNLILKNEKLEIISNLIKCNIDVINKIYIFDSKLKNLKFSYDIQDVNELKKDDKKIEILNNTVNFNERLNFEPSFLINIITYILLEKKIVFIADDLDFIFNNVNSILNLLNPFKWHYLLFIPLTKNFLSLLDSPFPFICGLNMPFKEIKEYAKRNNLIIIDLDNQIIKNKPKKIKLPFYDSLILKIQKKNYLSIFREYFDVLQNIIDNAREKTFLENILHFEEIINKPRFILEKIEKEHIDFFKLFFETRIFKNNLSLISSCDKKFNLTINENLISIIFNNRRSNGDKNIFKLFFRLLFNIKDNNTYEIDNLISFKNLDFANKKLAACYFMSFYSKKKQFTKISLLINEIKIENLFIDSKYFSNIYVEEDNINFSFFEFLDLSEYSFLIAENVKEKIKDQNLEGIEKNYFFVNYNNFDAKINILLIDEIIAFLDFFKYNNLSKKNFMEDFPEIFWNICLLFKKHGLPINFCDKIETNENLQFISSINFNLRCEPTFKKN